MPKAFVIVTEAVSDPKGMAAYSRAAGPSIAGSGGSVLVVDSQPTVLEGTWHGDQTVVLEFDSVEAAKGWYDSEGYQAALPLRLAAAECNAVIVTAFEAPVARS